MFSFLLKLAKMPAFIALVFILVYKKVLSPDHSFWAKRVYPHGYCRYHPTCSQYGYEAIKKFGLVKGSLKAFWRILRCNPWSRGGVDPVV